MGRQVLDRELKAAAVEGKLNILQKRLADCKDKCDYSDVLSECGKKLNKMGNILHLAAWYNQVEFFKQAINLVANHSHVLVETLLCYQEEFGDCPGYNPLHVAASVGSLDMVQAIKGYYTSNFTDSSYKNLPLHKKPWLAKDSTGSTPLHIALQDNQDCAKEILSLDSEALCASVDNSGNSPLFLAVRKGYDEVAKIILDSVPGCIATGEEFLTAVHYAPQCPVDVCKMLINKEVESRQDAIHKYKTPILHKWIELKNGLLLFKTLNDESQLNVEESQLNDEENQHIAEESQLNAVESQLNDEKNQHIAEESQLNAQENRINLTQRSREWIKNHIVYGITKCDHNNSNVFHLFASDQNMKDSKNLANFYNTSKGEEEMNNLMPWLKQNKSLETSLHVALKHDNNEAYKWLKDTYNDAPFKPDVVGPLIRAVKKRNYDVAKQIGETLVQYGWSPFCPHGNKIWQVQGDDRTHVEVAKWLVVNLPNLIPKKEAVDALKHASNNGYDWLVESVLKEHPSALDEGPLAWKEACEKGHYKTIVAFIENCPYFRELCLGQHTTPLHHVKFRGYEEYRQLVEIPVMKGLRNYQDLQGATPLHHAIQTQNIQLTEVLLNMDDASRTLENQNKQTPMQLLHDLFTNKNVEGLPKWYTMCIRNGITPGLKINYFRDKPKVYEVRNTLSVVAALLATITFTAGFTVPGGFDQVKGDALLGDKAAFIVFILCDAFAMFCSLVMLVFLMWSMICDHAKSLMLIDRSVYILLVALVSSVVSFMTGVYVVLEKKCLWLAIVIIVLCSLFVLAVYKPFVDWVLDLYSPKDFGKDVEQGQGTTSQAQQNADNNSWNYKKVFRCFGVGQSQQRKFE